jgi:uncharacterized protein YdhG (YjbR/CyaY superfamily)
MPAFKMHGKVVAGFAAFKNHLSYVPHSGSVVPALGDEIAGYSYTAGSLHFPVDKALPKKLVKRLIDVRLKQITGGGKGPSGAPAARHLPAKRGG